MPFFLAQSARDTTFRNVMEENTVLSLLESISGSDSLRKKFLDALQGPVQQNDVREGDATDPPVVPNHPSPISGESQLAANERQPGINASLGANAPQSRGVSLGASVLQSSGNPLGDGGPQYSVSEGATTIFDPDSLTSEDEFTFDTHQVIIDYLETHFRASLHKDVRSAMNKAHPVPRTPALKVPKVDGFVLDHLKQRFPKSRDHELGTIQAALQRCAGPLSCLWSELIDNDLLKSEDSVINVHDVLNVLQRTLVLLGNANELVSQTRRCNVLRAVDQGLEKYGKEPPSNNQEFLFGKEFCSQLKAQVESDKTLSQVVQLSHRYKPYDQKARQTTLGRSKKQFFRQSPAGNSGSRQGNAPPPNKQSYKSHFQQQPSSQAPTHSGRSGKS